jgi:hypothetical protein
MKATRHKAKSPRPKAKRRTLIELALGFQLWAFSCIGICFCLSAVLLAACSCILYWLSAVFAYGLQFVVIFNAEVYLLLAFGFQLYYNTNK